MISEGVINIDKPEGLTSHDVVARVRRRLGIKRTGHTGTLDPMASGVLPVCFGRATRMIQYYDGDFKTYEAEMRLGAITDTLDSTGTILETRDFSRVAETDVEEAFGSYTGEIRQIPPKFSALKVNGRPLYKYAREGADICMEDKARNVFIREMVLQGCDLEKGTVRFMVTCSKGTYIRSICDDIGAKLGCGGCMTYLRRTASGFFTEENAVDLGALMDMDDDELEKFIIPVDRTLVNLGTARLNSRGTDDFLNGRPVSQDDWNIVEKVDLAARGIYRAEDLENVFRVYREDGAFAGTGGLVQTEENGGYGLKALKVFR